MVEPRRFEETPPSFSERLAKFREEDPEGFQAAKDYGVGGMLRDTWTAYMGYRKHKGEKDREALGLLGRTDLTKEEQTKVDDFLLESIDFATGGGVKGIGGKKLIKKLLKSKNPIDWDLLSGVKTGRFQLEQLVNTYRSLRSQGAMGKSIGDMLETLPISRRAPIKTFAQRGKTLPASATRAVDAYDLEKADAHTPHITEILQGVGQDKAALVYLTPETFFKHLSKRYKQTGKEGLHGIMLRKDIVEGADKALRYSEKMEKGSKFPVAALWRQEYVPGWGRHYLHEGRRRTAAAAFGQGAEKIPVLVWHGAPAKNPATAFRRFGKHVPAPPQVQGPPPPPPGPTSSDIHSLFGTMPSSVGQQLKSSSVGQAFSIPSSWGKITSSGFGRLGKSVDASSSRPTIAEEFASWIARQPKGGLAESAGKLPWEVSSRRKLQKDIAAVFFKPDQSLSELARIKSIADNLVETASPGELDMLKKLFQKPRGKKILMSESVELMAGALGFEIPSK